VYVGHPLRQLTVFCVARILRIKSDIESYGILFMKGGTDDD